MNNKSFIKRIKTILDYYQLTASMFADKIGVQRSSISHMLSGRNKPSLDVILKITSEFPEVDMYWLLYGKGVFPRKVEEESVSSSLTLPLSDNEHPISKAKTLGTKKITKIVAFYEDGTFEEFIK